MIKRFNFSPIINTGAVVKELPYDSGNPVPFTLKNNAFSLDMDAKTRIYGLGETVRGINKRGWIYESWCTDEPFHNEDKRSLYGAHNFILVDGKERFGAFFDTPGKITFDLGYTDSDRIVITPESFALDLYIVTGDSLKAIVAEFRALIGKSYIPPLWAFGYGQSRWGYVTEKDIRECADNYEKAGIPLDMLYLDIDYMDSFKDFSVHPERFPDLKAFAAEMKERGIRLIPIIDAAVKKQDGYSVYDEGHEKGYFCKDENGEDFVVGVWPGKSVLPDFLNPEAARWFGMKYKALTDRGIEGFWNDMNEPALFYSEKGMDHAIDEVKKLDGGELDSLRFFGVRDVLIKLQNNADDYKSFYHNAPEGKFRHYDVHNLYGYNMTKSAYDALCELRDEPSLLFSRASYIGAHRYGGVWTGDNHAWWKHILQSLQQMPGMNMCGFLYSGSDIGGFNGNCTRDLLIRWMSFAVFTPLMRNHSAFGTRRQEAFAFGDTEAFRHIIGLRYRLIPYLYSEFVKAAENDAMFFRPLAFDYEEDEIVATVEDQLMVGDSMMIAPVYVQNAVGRHVYLPEKMEQIRMHEGYISTEELNTGWHYVDIPLGDVVFFTKSPIPLAKPAMNTSELDLENVEFI
ncbi:MAG: alpha-glucosidase [Ruminococcus sp.]|uniref:glycoside hydrolase family 31 protein n=1 Tax=Ruminococcus sp. TaxID=41978 RepID=UPI002872D2B0|nr:TIM-barrel domain-containing protein [Ruminococcus sp.]MBQ3285820.1 alpha-glucosidase [Ruminococcus sp.]